MLYLEGNRGPLRAFEQGTLLLGFLFLDPRGCSDLSAVKRGEGEGEDRVRGCPPWLGEPMGGSQNQALSSVGRWRDCVRVTGVGILV